ncbi:MAG: PilZ domain-containing protein [Desulfonatronovibrionaceae bacterium]
MEKQSRTYMRITTRIQGYIRRLASSDTRPLASACPSCFSGSGSKNLQSVQLPQDLLNYLKELDSKLDMILSLLNQEYLQNQFELQCDVVEISGAGLQFVSSKEFESGEAVEMVLILSQIPFRVVGLVGSIHRLEGHSGGKNIYAVEYTSIRDEDREAIVQFVFHEQREQIRERQNV